MKILLLTSEIIFSYLAACAHCRRQCLRCGGGSEDLQSIAGWCCVAVEKAAIMVATLHRLVPSLLRVCKVIFKTRVDTVNLDVLSFAVHQKLACGLLAFIFKYF